MSQTLVDGAGFTWDVLDNGTIGDGTSDAFDTAFRLTGYSPFDSKTLEGRYIVGATQVVDGLTIERRVYISSTGGWARFEDVITNTGTTTVTRAHAITSNLGSDSSTTLITSSSGDANLTTSDAWLITDDGVDLASGDPRLGFVFRGTSKPGTVSQATLTAGDDDMSVTYPLTLAAGETAVVMYFGMQSRNAGDILGLATSIATNPGAFTIGMTPERRHSVINFDLPKVTVSASVSTTLTPEQDNLILTGSNPISGTGNDYDNVISGNGANNILDGRGGNDRLFGFGGADTLIGGDGNDYLDGGTNPSTRGDSMRGGTGNDRYVVNSSADRVVELADGGRDSVTSSVSFTLAANVENLTLTGTAINGSGNALANTIIGNSQNNSLRGFDGADYLDGGLGSDYLVGGGGNDTYVIDRASDRVIETSDGGTDTVLSSVTYTLGSHVENLTLKGSANINGIGNAGHNKLLGNSGSNTLWGGIGNDVISGGAGTDTASYLGAAATLTIDLRKSSAQNTGAAGVDTLLSIENITGGSGINRITGSNSANIIEGGGRGDDLKGAGGNDILRGFGGNDVLYGELQTAVPRFTRLSETSFTAAAGKITFDAVGTTNPSYTLNVAGLGAVTVKTGGWFIGQDGGSLNGSTVNTLTDATPTTATPLRLDDDALDTFISTDGSSPTSPILSGTPTFNGPISVLFSKPVAGVGLTGGYFNAVKSTVIEAYAADGTVLGRVTNTTTGIEFFGLALSDGSPLIAGISFYINGNEPAGFGIDNLTFSAASAINDVRNNNDELYGGSGDDQLFGGVGTDLLQGESGNDTITGGSGRDTMTGGAGSDQFDFNATSETGKTSTTRDIIKDFSHADRIDLSTIDANGSAAGNGSFVFLAAKGAAFTGVDGQLRWFQINSSNNALDKTIIAGDINGDRVTDFEIELTGLKTMVRTDFIL